MEPFVHNVAVDALPRLAPFTVWLQHIPEARPPTARVAYAGETVRIVKLSYIIMRSKPHSHPAFVVVHETNDASSLRSLPAPEVADAETVVIDDPRNLGAHYARIRRGETHMMMWASPPITADVLAAAVESLTALAEG